MVKSENRRRWSYSSIRSNTRIPLPLPPSKVDIAIQTNILFENTRTVNKTPTGNSTVLLNHNFSSSFCKNVNVFVRYVRVFSFDFYGFHGHQLLLPFRLSLFCKLLVFLDVIQPRHVIQAVETLLVKFAVFVVNHSFFICVCVYLGGTTLVLWYRVVLLK